MGVSADKVGRANLIITLKCLSSVPSGLQAWTFKSFPIKATKNGETGAFRARYLSPSLQFFFLSSKQEKTNPKVPGNYETLYNELSLNDVVLELRIYMDVVHCYRGP